MRKLTSWKQITMDEEVYMARRVFISFRFSDGEKYKTKLCELFDGETKVINCSENEDRSGMSEETIQKYLYSKLKTTSVTIIIITPQAINHKKDMWGRYDDWMYDEIRYSLEDRENNRCNGIVAVYTPEAKEMLMKETLHTCDVCKQESTVSTIFDVDNLFRKNMMNVKKAYKTNPCEGIYDSDKDSYCSLVEWEEFKKNYNKYIDKLKLAGDDINMSFAIKQGQPIATYLAINNASNNKKSPFIKRMYPQIKSNTISMSLPFVSEEDKVKENDIYLRMGTTNQLELIMLDSAGRIQRYYILVEPNVKSANKTEKIEKKVKKVNENGNDSKYYSAGTAELNYTLVTSPNIVFECNLINPETIDNYIESYKEEVSDIKYGEDISGEKIYDNMVKINDLVKTQLF